MLAALVAFIIALIIRGASDDFGKARRLPDGSTLLLEQVVLTSTNFAFAYRGGGKFVRSLARVLPAFIQKRLSPSSGSLGFSSGTSGETNLVIITINRGDPKTWNSTLGRLQLLDEEGRTYDASWGAGTLGMGDATVHGWGLHAFPRRNRTLGLRFLARQPDGSWTHATDLRIRNPAFAEYPQWQPEPPPHEKSDGALTVKLLEFQTGIPFERDRKSGPAMGRATRLAFSFAENGAPSKDWRIQKVTLSDATGNCWSPHLDFVEQRFNWASNGTVHFVGALWPGEEAWRLQVEVVRSAGFAPGEVWEVPLTLPVPRMVNTLTNSWERDGAVVTLVALASPETDHVGDFRWTAKWWGSEKSKVYSLALSFHSEARGKRLSVIGCTDQDGATVKLMSHQNQDSDQQAIFLRPSKDATELRLTLALQRSRFVQFLTQPNFVTDGRRVTIF